MIKIYDKIGSEYNLCKVGRRKITLIKNHDTSRQLRLLFSSRVLKDSSAKHQIWREKIDFALHCEKMDELQYIRLCGH